MNNRNSIEMVAMLCQYSREFDLISFDSCWNVYIYFPY
jgi:hypothetical protein